MDTFEAPLCPDADIEALAAVIAEDADRGLESLGALLAVYPGDPRLHFLEGSVLAGQARYMEGVRAMQRAVELAPGYDIARFQLGFLQLTGGDAAAALGSWSPLRALPEASGLRWFVRGLTCLSEDRLADAVSALLEGMRRADVMPEMAADMRKIVDAIEAMSTDGDTAERQTSADHLLLQRYIFDGTRH